MKNKPFQNMLRGWIAIASLGAFIGGWAMLAHSGTPVDTASAGTTQSFTLPTLAPLASSNTRSMQPLQSNSTTGFAQPRLRTRGS